jgi:hypothetical protein
MAIGEVSDMVWILAGARGAAGRIHARIHRSLGNRLVEFDIADAVPSARLLRSVPWDEAVMDVCTPTAAHVQSMAWGYARGVRRFLIEKPAAASLAAWQRQLAEMPDAQIFVVHPYLYSRSFHAALETVPAVSEITTAFDKDREFDDGSGRGAGPDGRLPHLFQVEAPHQFAIALAVAPGLRVVSAAFDGRAGRGADPEAPVAGSVTLSDTHVSQVRLATNLRAPRRRELRLSNDEGGCAFVRFPTAADLIGRVWTRDRHGRTKTVFEDTDDLLRNTFVRAIDSFRQSAVPLEASARFASTVLARIDEAIALAAWHSPGGPASPADHATWAPAVAPEAGPREQATASVHAT